jgi:DNA-binding MarR family transcriptional regulator
MTRIVKALESEGFITRAPDESDRRVAWLRATPKGEQLMRQGRSARIALLAEWLRPLASKERRTLGEAGMILERVLEIPRRERKA